MGKTKLVKFAKMGKQPTMGQKKTKEAIAKAAAASKKGGKKKWSKGKVKDKLNNACFLDKKTYDKYCTEMSKMHLITISNLADRFKIIGSLARPMIKKMLEEGKVRAFGNQTSKLYLCTGTHAKGAVEEEVDVKKKGKK